MGERIQRNAFLKVQEDYRLESGRINSDFLRELSSYMNRKRPNHRRVSNELTDDKKTVRHLVNGLENRKEDLGRCIHSR